MSKVVRKERRLLTPQEYVARQVLSYPSLYAYEDKETAKYAVLDQLLNVIGNGIRDSLELKREVYALKEVVVDFERAEKYYKEPIFIGYTKSKKTAGYSFPDSESSIGYVLEEDKHLHPDVEVWIDSKPKQEIPGVNCPYPNFKEEYSLLYKSDFKSITSPEWVAAAIWYYEESLKFFEGEYSAHYSYAYPCATQQESEYQLCEMKNRLETQYKWDHEAISKAYMAPFDGDVEKFMSIRWKSEKKRIIEFIQKAIQCLKADQ